MGRHKSLGDRFHEAMHRLPGVPDHDDAYERNGNRSGRLRALRWNTALNEAGRARAARWNSNAFATQRHARPPRVLVSWQTWIGNRLSRGE